MSKTKKVISVVLAAALIMAMATVAMFSASAATTVYFENSEGWANVCAYVWGGALGEEFGAWPGTECTNVEGNIWSIDIPDDCTHVIFNNDNNGKQTNNLENPGSTKIAKLGAGVEENEFGIIMDVYAWETYGNVEETTAAPVETTVAPVETTAAPVETTVAESVETTAAPVETTVAEPVETTAAPVETTAAPVETTAVVEPVETTAAPEEPEETTAAVEGGIIVDGTDYTAEAGAEITYVANLKTPNKIEDVQGYVTYDASKLTIVEASTPNILGAIINTGEAGVVYFNATEVNNGMDFTTEAALIQIKFTVVDGTNTEIALTLEEMTERNGGSYFTDSEKVNADVTVAELLTVPEETQPTETTEATVPTTATVEPTTTTVVEPTKAPETNVTGGTDAPVENPDVPVTGSTVAIYAVLAALAMAAAAVVVLRKKVNG